MVLVLNKFHYLFQALVERIIASLGQCLRCPRLIEGAVDDSTAALLLGPSMASLSEEVLTSLHIPRGEHRACSSIIAQTKRVYDCLRKSLVTVALLRRGDDGGEPVLARPVQLFYPKLMAYRCLLDIVHTCLQFTTFVYDSECV